MWVIVYVYMWEFTHKQISCAHTPTDTHAHIQELTYIFVSKFGDRSWERPKVSLLGSPSTTVAKFTYKYVCEFLYMCMYRWKCVYMIFAYVCVYIYFSSLKKCLKIYIYIYIHIYVQTHTHTHTHIYIYIYIYICICICMYVCVFK